MTTMRDDFEAHMLALKKWPDDGHAFQRDQNGNYVLTIVEATFFGWQAATLKANQWMPIADAMEGVLVVCCWVDKDDGDMRHNFDYLEDGVWQNYFNEHEHYLIAGAASGRSEDAPYTHFVPLPLPPTGTEGTA